MLAAIGETFETPVQGSEEEAKLKAAGPPTTPVTSDLITGVILSARPHFYRLAIWTRHAPASTAAPAPGAEDDPIRARILAVGRHFKQVVLGYGSDDKLMADGRGYQTEIEFISHSDSERKDKKHNKIVI
jgi:translation initiation factor 4E